MQAPAARDRSRAFSAAPALTALGGALAYLWWLYKRPYFPNTWLGDLGIFPVEHSLGFLLLLIALAWLLANGFQERNRLALVIGATLLVAALFMHRVGPTYESRFRSERSAYISALNGPKYGHQFEESHGGRRLVYWRWYAAGVDNAIGIIYDPADALKADAEEIKTAFKTFTHGVIFRVRRLEKNWYYVSHS